MKLETDRIVLEDVSAEQLRAELALLDPEGNNRAILSISDEVYIQTAAVINGFLIEKRDGPGEQSHFHAVPDHEPLPPLKPQPPRGWLARLLGMPHHKASNHAFSLDQLHAVFAAYLAGTESAQPVRWEPGYCVG